MEFPLYFEEVTLLVTHYNRSQSLERLLSSFNTLQLSFAATVVSDDGSKKEHLERLINLQKKYPFTLVTTPVNKGLGNNINKGQQAVITPYTLYVQEDFVPKPSFRESFAAALYMLQQRNELDMARFYAYFKYPYLLPAGHGFSEMIFKPWYWGYRKFYMYSDHPHLRRSNFSEKFGRYPEGIKGDATEYRMMMNFLQKKGRGIFYEDYKGLFDQENSAAEPGTMKRSPLRNSDNVFITGFRNLYRHIKFNYDYHFKNK